jgi:hypothetical protein
MTDPTSPITPVVPDELLRKSAQWLADWGYAQALGDRHDLRNLLTDAADLLCVVVTELGHTISDSGKAKIEKLRIKLRATAEGLDHPALLD